MQHTSQFVTVVNFASAQSAVNTEAKERVGLNILTNVESCKYAYHH